MSAGRVLRFAAAMMDAASGLNTMEYSSEKVGSYIERKRWTEGKSLLKDVTSR